MPNLNTICSLLAITLVLNGCGGGSNSHQSSPTITPQSPGLPAPKPDLPPLVETPKPSIEMQKVSFFIAAHPDDIELFMGRQAYHQIADSLQDKKVFIVLSGGDGNQKNNKLNKTITWWEAREQAHTLAISFWNSFKQEPLSNEIIINNKYLQKISIGSNIVLYNFRFLDYDPTTSLDDLIKDNNKILPDLKYNQSYSLQDINQSLEEIIRQESKKASAIDFNMTDDDPVRNPWDHKDHYATASITNNLYLNIDNPCKSLTKYLAYGFKKSPINLEGEDKERSFKLWTLMGDKLASYGYKRNDDHIHMTLVGKEYKSLEIKSSCKDI